MKYLYRGDEGTLAEYLQLALTRAGFPAKVDGIMGERTCAALSAFLGEDTGCVVNQSVWQKLLPYLKGYTSYRIGSGDTLDGLAARYRTSIAAISSANPDADPLNLEVGTVINVPFGFPLVPGNVKYTSQLLSWIAEGLKVRYPFMEWGDIGNSVMGKRIPYVKIGDGEKEMFYNASFHANENITTPILLKFAEEYAKAYASGKELYGEEAVSLYHAYALYLVPMVNPDGVDLVNGALENGIFYRQAEKIAADYPQIPFPDGWKANLEGTDLNLQFPAGWENARRIKFSQGYTSPAPRDYVGSAPLAAPESNAVYQFTRQHDFLLILAYHTQGEVIYWKYLNYEPENSRTIAEYFGEVSGYAVELTPGESGYAGYKDWFIQDYNRPGYTIEAGLGENPLPMSQFDAIYEANKGILLGGMTQI